MGVKLIISYVFEINKTFGCLFFKIQRSAYYYKLLLITETSKTHIQEMQLGWQLLNQNLPFISVVKYYKQLINQYCITRE